MDLNVKDDVPGGRILRVTSNQDAKGLSVNGMHLCVKGRYGYEFIHDVRRHTRPLVRQYLLDGTPRPKGRGKWVEVDWDTALRVAAEKLRIVRDIYGGKGIGVLASGKCLNEESYLVNKLARQVLKTNNIDCASHIYHSSVVEGLIESIGIPAVSDSFEEVADHAHSLLVIGSNLTEQHPVLGARVRQAILRRKVKMVVANPDFINIAEYAALPLYHRPKTETALINGLIYIILEKGWESKAAVKKHNKGFPKFKAIIDRYSPSRVAEITGIPQDELYQAAEILALNKPMAIIWSVGIADLTTGRGNVQSLSNLKLLLGDLETPGGGIYPLQSQNNLQGAFDMGNLPDMLPGYQEQSDQSARLKFEQAWKTELPSQPGLKSSQILASAREDQIKALYILGEDVLESTPEAARVRQSLAACEFILLQEVLSSDTTRYADVLLPSVSFAEKSGTFTSSERRIQMVHQAIQPVGKARPDWQIITSLAGLITSEKGEHPDQVSSSGWDYSNTAQIMEEIAALTPIYSGVSHTRLESGEVLMWPVTSGEHPLTTRLSPGAFSNEVTRLIPVEQIETDSLNERSPELTLSVG
jgi:predicted molibdopterin-dependent oxidoreductase YjgC